jgi:hypothetical protein
LSVSSHHVADFLHEVVYCLLLQVSKLNLLKITPTLVHGVTTPFATSKQGAPRERSTHRLAQL